MSSESFLRLFFALPCPKEQAVAICVWRDAQGFDGRAVPVANLHLTLAFLGNQPRERLESLLALAGELRGAAFPLCLERLGVIGKGFACLLPGTTPPALSALVAELGERLHELGIATDSRPFLPHLTLLRQMQGQRHATPPAFAWTARRFVLYSSENIPGGVRYRELGSWPLTH